MNIKPIVDAVQHFKQQFKVTYPIRPIDILNNMQGVLNQDINIYHPIINRQNNALEITLPNKQNVKLFHSMLLECFAHFVLHTSNNTIYYANPFYRKEKWLKEQAEMEIFIMALLMPPEKLKALY